MPEAIAIADARMTAPVASSVTFQHTTCSAAMAVAQCRRRSQLRANHKHHRVLAGATSGAGTCSKMKTLRQMASEKESFLHTRSSR
jgi:hypothetical protein